MLDIASPMIAGKLSAPHWTGAPRRGFTLLELVVAIAILGLVGGVALPAFRDEQTDAVTRTAERVMALLERARLESLQKGTLVRVVLDLESGEYSVRAAGGGSDSPYASGRLEIPVEVSLTAQETSASARDAVARFDPSGRARCTSITVAKGALRAEVSCDPWTGAVAARR